MRRAESSQLRRTQYTLHCAYGHPALWCTWHKLSWLCIMSAALPKPSSPYPTAPCHGLGSLPSPWLLEANADECRLWLCRSETAQWCWLGLALASSRCCGPRIFNFTFSVLVPVLTSLALISLGRSLSLSGLCAFWNCVLIGFVSYSFLSLPGRMRLKQSVQLLHLARVRRKKTASSCGSGRGRCFCEWGRQRAFESCKKVKMSIDFSESHGSSEDKVVQAVRKKMRLERGREGSILYINKNILRWKVISWFTYTEVPSNFKRLNFRSRAIFIACVTVLEVGGWFIAGEGKLFTADRSGSTWEGQLLQACCYRAVNSCKRPHNR